MENFFSHYNILILISSISVMILWYIWYSPLLFWTAWLRLRWVSKQNITALNLSFSFIWAFLLSTFMILFYSFVGVNSYIDWLYLSLFVGLLCVAPTMLTQYIFVNAPLRLILIEVWYQICSIILIWYLFVLL